MAHKIKCDGCGTEKDIPRGPMGMPAPVSSFLGALGGPDMMTPLDDPDQWGQLSASMFAHFDLCSECIAKIVKLLELKMPEPPTEEEMRPPFGRMRRPAAGPRTGLVGAMTASELESIRTSDGGAPVRHVITTLTNIFSCSCGAAWQAGAELTDTQRLDAARQAIEHAQTANRPSAVPPHLYSEQQ